MHCIVFTYKTREEVAILVTASSLTTAMFQEGQTALHQAASAGHGETVAALILGGCDIGIQDFVSIYTTHL